MKDTEATALAEAAKLHKEKEQLKQDKDALETQKTQYQALVNAEVERQVTQKETQLKEAYMERTGTWYLSFLGSLLINVLCALYGILRSHRLKEDVIEAMDVVTQALSILLDAGTGLVQWIWEARYHITIPYIGTVLVISLTALSLFGILWGIIRTAWFVWEHITDWWSRCGEIKYLFVPIASFFILVLFGDGMTWWNHNLLSLWLLVNIAYMVLIWMMDK